MAIWRPGRPSSMNRAATSLMRVAPLVMTTNWITTRIRNRIAPDDDRFARDELAERPDHAARRVKPVGAAPGEDQPRGGDVQDQAGQRRDDQDRRERVEVLRLADRQHGQEDQDGERDVRREEQVQDQRGQRHDEHDDRADDRRREDDRREASEAASHRRLRRHPFPRERPSGGTRRQTEASGGHPCPTRARCRAAPRRNAALSRIRIESTSPRGQSEGEESGDAAASDVRPGRYRGGGGMSRATEDTAVTSRILLNGGSGRACRHPVDGLPAGSRPEITSSRSKRMPPSDRSASDTQARESSSLDQRFVGGPRSSPKRPA